MWIAIVALLIFIFIWARTYKAAVVKHPGTTKGVAAGHIGGVFGGVVFALLFLFVAVEILGLGESKKGDSKAGVAASASPTTAAETITVDADELAKDYKANEVAADRTYKGKPVQVIGHVKSIEKDAFGKIIVSLDAKGSFMGIRGTVDDSEADASADLQKGKVIALVCTGDGMTIGTPMLKKCKIR